MSEQKYLISIAIGPVQDFIASARRSRDLWFGSWLLSELSKVVAEEILKQKGELIFPANLNGKVVNKILAIVDKPQNDFNNDLRKIVNKKLHDIYSKKFAQIKTKLSDAGLSKSDFKEDVAIKQIEDLTEIYWTAVPYNPSKYDECRNKVELLLNARKATRDFNAVTWGSIAPKSSLDGQRESVIEDDLIKNNEIKAQKIFGLRKKERLCGVGILKRLEEKGTDDRFFSTSHVASLPLILSLENNDKNKELVEDYVHEISNQLNEIENLHRYFGKVPDGLESEVFGKYDGHLLFENRLKDFPFENGNLDKAKKALKTFMLKAFGKEDKKPNPYFAMLQADGDRMGTVIDNQDTPEKHKDLSKALSKFANDVKDTVKNHKGCLIYAGGDDVLAMLPLHTVLDCTRELADEFAKKLNRFSDKDENYPTLSAGIAIVHHTEPLQESLVTMRNAEKEAKSVKGKNALAIILSKRSGADTTIKGSWSDDRETGKSFDERLKRFIYLHLADALPDGLAYEIRDLWIRFQDDMGKPAVREGLLKAETLRILKRKKSQSGTKQIDEKVFDYLEDLIKKISFSTEDKWTLIDLANEVIVARDFAKVYKQAGINAEKFAKENKLEDLEK